MKLREYLKGQYLDSLLMENSDSRAIKFLDAEVVRKVDGCKEAFPGSHRNVYVWWEMVSGHAIGLNENPSRGWSFPVVKLR